MRSRSAPFVLQQRADPGVELLRVDRAARPRSSWSRSSSLCSCSSSIPGSPGPAPGCGRGRRRPGPAPASIGTLRRSVRMDRREAVDGADPRLDRLQLLRRHQIDLVQHDHVGEGDLVRGLGLSASRAGRFLASTTVTIASSRVFARTPSSTKKVCATGAGLARPVVSMMMPSNFVAPLHQPADDADQVAAHGAADAAVVHLEHFLVGIHDEVVIHAEFAELVDRPRRICGRASR